MRLLLLKPYQVIGVPPVISPPLGLLSLAAAVRARFGAAARVEILDLKARRRSAEWLARRLPALQPDVVGVSALNFEGRAAREIAHAVKHWNPDAVTVLGGPHAHRRAAELLGRSEFDWIFAGPGERSFPEALARRAAGADLGADIPGFSHRRGAHLHVAPDQDFIPELDGLPLPAWDLVDFDEYARLPNMMAALKGRRYAVIFTSRGCPFQCTYCHDLFGRRFVHRSPVSVLEEIALLHERFGVDELEIVDDIFNLDKRRLIAIMGEVARRWPGRLHFSFPNGLRGDLLDEEVLDALKAAGTYAMSIAVETVSPRLQALVKKKLDLGKVTRAIAAADRRGIMVTGFFMLGFPTETVAEIQATVDYALQSPLTTASFFCVVPQPGTPLFELACAEAPHAVARDADEAGGAVYRNVDTWYERAYGFPLGPFIRRAYRRFFLDPRRLWRVFTRVPPRSLWMGGRHFVDVLTPFSRWAARLGAATRRGEV